MDDGPHAAPKGQGHRNSSSSNSSSSALLPTARRPRCSSAVMKQLSRKAPIFPFSFFFLFSQLTAALSCPPLHIFLPFRPSSSHLASPCLFACT